MMHKILVIRFSSIGDIVLTTPVLRVLKQQLGAEVHFLTKKSFAKILSANPNVDHIWSIEKKIVEILPDLKKEDFTAIVDLHNNLRSRRTALNLRAVPCYRFDKLNWQKWLLTKLKINRLPAIHIVDRYLNTAKPLGVKNDQKGLDHYIPDNEKVDPKTLLPDNKIQAYYTFVIGAAHATKRLSDDKIITIARSLSQPVMLIGGPDEKAAGDAIAAAAGKHCVNTCGMLPLHGSASLISQSGCVITHDTGMMHIAAAFNKPILSVWGNTVPEFGMYPYLPDSQSKHVVAEVKDLSCRPCSKIGYQACPKGHFKCMKEQNVPAVLNAAVQLIR